MQLNEIVKLKYDELKQIPSYLYKFWFRIIKLDSEDNNFHKAIAVVEVFYHPAFKRQIEPRSKKYLYFKKNTLKGTKFKFELNSLTGK